MFFMKHQNTSVYFNFGSCLLSQNKKTYYTLNSNWVYVRYNLQILAKKYLDYYVFASIFE